MLITNRHRRFPKVASHTETATAWRRSVSRAVLAAGLGWLLLALAGVAPAQSVLTQPRLDIQYQVDLRHPANHLVDVSLNVGALDGAPLDFQMPWWYPGRYSIFNFGVNVQDVGVQCLEPAGPLSVVRTQPATWHVETAGCHRLRFHYRAYNNTLDGTFAQLDGTHANLNGGSVYMYVKGHKPDPVTLDIAVPTGWRVLNALGDLNQTHLQFPNYDVFIDAPTEAGPDFTLDTFQQDGKTYRVMIHSYLPEGHNHAPFLAALQRLVAAENTIVGPNDLSTYTFFFHFDPQANHGDGMEHLYGTQIMLPLALGEETGLKAAESVAAHEFFHQWNVKRIRPAELGPWDYTRPNPTYSLWVAEGLTQYFGEITLARAGLVSDEDYLDGLAATIANFEQLPGHSTMSAADSSLTAWFHDGTPLRQETNSRATTISYYQKGNLLGVVLDLDLRARTGGQKSLKDVLRYLWNNNYMGATTSYYLRGHGYTQADVQHAIEAVGGASYADFFRDYVFGTKELPYQTAFDHVGLKLLCTPTPGNRSYAGLQVTGNQVSLIAPDGPADEGGLGTDDQILTLNGKTVDGSELAAKLRKLPPSQPVTLTGRRHLRPFTVTFTPSAPHPDACYLTQDPNASPSAVQQRRQWLTEP